MSVDTLRETFHINRISTSDLQDFLTAQTYRPEITQAKNHILSLKNCSLQAVCTKPIQQGKSPKYAEKGLKCIKPKNTNDMLVSIDDIDWIDSSTKGQIQKQKLAYGDIVITRSGSGTIGRASIYCYSEEAYTNDHLFVVRPDKADSHYICSFLNSFHGQRLLEAGVSGSTGQLNLSNEHIKSIPLFRPDDKVQRYIGDKVRQAEQLRAWAKRLNSVLQSQIHSVFKGDPKPEKRIGKIISIQQLSSLRLEAEYYGDLELWAELEIKNSPFPNKPLGELSSRIKDGPGGWAVSTSDYRPSGTPVIRSVNLIDGRCELEDCVFISKEKHNDLRSHQVKSGGLLLSVRGTIGRAAVFDSVKYSTASLNAAVVTIDCKPTINPYYLAAFLNSEVGRIQSNRIANGAVQLNMNLKETASNLIVIPPINLQETIAATFLSKNRAIILANLLTQSAKTLVEALIEGQLTEQQLIQAQQALEDGDNSLDQAIISKLSAEGYAIEGATPLFSDVDELYSLLEDAAQAEAEE